MKIDRLLGLLSVLANTDKVTVQELADCFEVSKRTIFRDLDTLNQAGIPIVSYPGTGGGIAVVEGYKWKSQILTEKDAENIFTALCGLKSIEGDSSVTSLIAKLAPEKEAVLFAQSEYVIDLSSWFTGNFAREKIRGLHQAIRGRQYVRMEYISKSRRAVRTTEPHKLVFKQSGWYLYAYCLERKAFCLFRLNRIVSFEILDATFEPRPAGKIEFLKYSDTEFFSMDYKEGFLEVVLEYDPLAEFELTDQVDAFLFAGQKDDLSGMGEIRFYTSDLSRAADFVLKIAEKARVVSPPELLDQVRDRIKKIYSVYEG